MRYLILSMAALIAVVFAAALWLVPQYLQPSTPDRSTGKALIGGDFSMVDHNGKPFTQDNLKGKYALVYFGFTHCPDICPTGLMIISNALKSLNGKAEKIQPVFVSVDPERDTPDILAQYVQAFHPSFIGLTGSLEQVQQIADAYKVYFSKVEDEDSALGYLVDHSGYIYLMDPKGEYLAHFPHNVAEQTLSAKLLQYISN